jgi:hypothetical protein
MKIADAGCDTGGNISLFRAVPHSAKLRLDNVHRVDGKTISCQGNCA